MGRVGRGETPPPLPETGPTEIVALNHGFNAMLGNLRQIERDRALLLAGISHDLRTPLARLRLGVEMGGGDGSTRDGMVADIEEMDRIVGQFLEFARGEDGATVEAVDLNGARASRGESLPRIGQGRALCRWRDRTDAAAHRPRCRACCPT